MGNVPLVIKYNEITKPEETEEKYLKFPIQHYTFNAQTCTKCWKVGIPNKISQLSLKTAAKSHEKSLIM